MPFSARGGRLAHTEHLVLGGVAATGCLLRRAVSVSPKRNEPPSEWKGRWTGPGRGDRRVRFSLAGKQLSQLPHSGSVAGRIRDTRDTERLTSLHAGTTLAALCI